MNPITSLIETFLSIYILLIFAHVLLSWVPLDRSNPLVDQVVRFIYSATEPVLQPIRRMLPPMPVDFSPMIVILVITLLMRLL
ncbi:MAG: YggT family protein [Anaerolineae bacterium]|nr:YggT family protein [Anaerolineae bacterium]MCK6578570.1 YggT family protein [Anaerolineae bacterium]NUQ02695.1 YggT family protein [Anaerolineae bacterium]